MRLVYQAASVLDAQLVCDMLLDAGFNAVVRGGYLSGAIGELPPDTLVAVSILPNPLQSNTYLSSTESTIESGVPDSDYQRARELIARFEADAESASGLHSTQRKQAGSAEQPFLLCSNCGEACDPEFAVCWNCQNVLEE